MSATPVEVRRASLADVPQLSAGFARAFYDDPLMSWMVPDPRTRLERLERFFAHTLQPMIAKDLRDIYTTTDVAGSAMWGRPDEWKTPVRRMLPGVPGLVRAVGLASLVRIGRAQMRLDNVHPHEPHMYLEGLATDPPHQRRGVASALLRVVLDKCDADGLPAYLSTQKPENVPFYARHGFVVSGEVDIPGGGPHMWLMWRERS